MIIGFTGTREGLTEGQAIVLDEMANLGEFGGENHHGDCVGADAEFDYFARRYSGSVVIHPPVDGTYRAYCHEKDYFGLDPYHEEIKVLPEKPYLERNRDIVDACELLIACPKQERGPNEGLAPKLAGGTWYTVRYAKSQGKRINIIWPDGTVTEK